MNAITDKNVETNSSNFQVDEDDEDYLTSESSDDDDRRQDELDQDNNNNKETADSKKNCESTISTVDTDPIVTSNVPMKIRASEENKSMVVEAPNDLKSNTM